jgi:hypothetical protein
MHKSILLLSLILALYLPKGFAQADSTSRADSAMKTKKPLMLSFGADINLSGLGGGYNYDYTGEYNKYGSPVGGWEWVNHKTSFGKLLDNSKYTEVKLSIMGGTNKNFKIGLGYNFGYISCVIPQPVFDSINNPGKKIDYVHHDISYAGICVMAEYNYYFNKETNMGLYAFGNADLGFYTGTDDIFGPGIPFFLQGKIGLGYNFQKDIMLRAFVATDQLIYRESSKSQVYQKTQTLNIDLNTWYIGIGFVKMFTIFPD